MEQIGLSSGRPLPLTGRLSRRKLPIRLGNMKQRVAAVLVPADVATQVRGKNKESRSHQPGQSRGLAGVLLSAMRIWERQEQQKIPTEELLAQAAVRGDQVIYKRQFLEMFVLVHVPRHFDAWMVVTLP